MNTEFLFAKVFGVNSKFCWSWDCFSHKPIPPGGELMKLDYQRKVAMLNKQKKRGTNSEALEKIKAAVSHLHTRYIVDMQSMDSTVLEINRLRDEQLYPKLVQLVDGYVSF
ncbi:hypothetical protein WN944_005957 [Citrus x changshan-huyou]|uniref:DUF632 domain-containing protein n=1 Tax=Citrus x changshan-huyou TaxID=2935761 RepID=A0AAP0MIB0_9ROSI